MTPRRTVLAGVVLGVVFFAVVCALPRIGLYRGHLGTSEFQSYGDRTLSGHVPYRDFSLEYPPGALPAFVAPSLGPAGDYDRLFEAFELGCGLAVVALAAVALGALRAPRARLFARVAFAALAPLALGPLTLRRYDLWAVALMTGAVAALLHGRVRLAFAALAAGAAAKLFPLALLPLALAYVDRRRRREAALAFVACGLVIVGPFVLLAPGGVADSLLRQLRRPLQIETLGSSAILVAHELGAAAPGVEFGSGSWNLVGTVPNAVAALQTAALAATLVALWWRFARGPRGADELLVASAAAVAAWLVFGKVLSPQFLLWLLPLVVLVASRRRVWLAPVLLAALGLTQAVYPARYDALVRLEALPVALLAARNALLVLLGAWVANDLVSTGRLGRTPARGPGVLKAARTSGG
jgi:hypothetical protein